MYAVGGSREAARLCRHSGGRAARVRRLRDRPRRSERSGGHDGAGVPALRPGQRPRGPGLELLVITAVIIGGAAAIGGSGPHARALVVGVLLIGAPAERADPGRRLIVLADGRDRSS
ncbi:MAG: hypothetical protein WKG07_36140 [Hymenobacter sp.]